MNCLFKYYENFTAAIPTELMWLSPGTAALGGQQSGSPPALGPLSLLFERWQSKGRGKAAASGLIVADSFSVDPSLHIAKEQGHKVLPPKIASGCFVNLMAVKVATVCSVVRGDLLVVGFNMGFESLWHEGGMRSGIWLCLPPTSRSCEHVGWHNYSSFQRSALCLEGAAAIPRGEISVGGFYSPRAFLFEILQRGYPASTCLRLASYLCSLWRKPIKKCFSSSSPFSFSHLILPIPLRTPGSLLAVQIHLRSSADMAKAMPPHE